MSFVKTAFGAAAVALTFGTVAAAETTIFYGHSGPARGTVPAALKWLTAALESCPAAT
ncbi:hypothetical protein [Pseudophaeobacter leonis]|uniref:hypothetical protein n=1 Tax=Pseudophaeobacter leonis TaxID=1144477 RepID=UPI001F4EF2CE|nr:hypothetical protein [Pseudophaeobacter leonis]